MYLEYGHHAQNQDQEILQSLMKSVRFSQADLEENRLGA